MWYRLQQDNHRYSIYIGPDLLMAVCGMGCQQLPWRLHVYTYSRGKIDHFKLQFIYDKNALSSSAVDLMYSVFPNCRSTQIQITQFCLRQDRNFMTMEVALITSLSLETSKRCECSWPFLRFDYFVAWSMVWLWHKFSSLSRRQAQTLNVLCGGDPDQMSPITGTTSQGTPFSFTTTFTSSSSDGNNTDAGFSLLILR